MSFNSLSKIVKMYGMTYSLLQATKKKDNIEAIKKVWATNLLNSLSCELQIKGEVRSKQGPLIFVGNHISYLDIPILIKICPQIQFVSKAEILSWPLVGSAAKKAGTIFVQRESKKSRNQVGETIEYNLKEKLSQIAIFPAGTTSLCASKWHRRIFNIAQELKVPVQPFRFSYDPIRVAAYLDDDFLPSHVFNLLKKKGIKAEIEFANLEYIDDPQLQLIKIQTWCERKEPKHETDESFENSIKNKRYEI